MDSKLFKVTINMKEITEEGTLNENDITILKLIAKSINFIQIAFFSVYVIMCLPYYNYMQL